MLMGLFGYAVEIWYTTIDKAIDLMVHCTNISVCLINIPNGESHIAAFLIYGFGSVIYSFLYEPFRHIRIVIKRVDFIGSIIRYCIYALLFMASELFCGIFLKYVIHSSQVWDYSRTWGNIMGLTTFSMFFAWFIAGAVGEFIHKRLLVIDEYILNFHKSDKSKYYENIKENRRSQFERYKAGKYWN
jgi:hypothetical protein